MHSINKVSAAEAQKMIDTVVAETAKKGQSVAISISGPEGELIAFLRMDGASPAASLIAQNKSYTAARDRKSTKAMGEFMLNNDRPPAFWGDKGITGFGGGMPILYDGKVIGGIGVSGLSEGDDEQLCNLAIKAVYNG
jgi:glc operon protein GlcG